MGKYVVWFKDLNKNSISIAGGKGANVGEMFNLNFPVPPGFAVTAQCYKEYIKRTGLKARITSLLKGLDVEDTQNLQRVAEQIQQLFLATPIPEEMAEEIRDNYELLGANRRKAQDLVGSQDVFVAVRSSATAEDLPSASFAGQQATFLNVKGKTRVVTAVLSCWASLFTARAIYYRQKNNFDHMKVFISAIVQKMVNSDQSGIMFTVNPATNNAKEIVIEAVYGLGEMIVGGEVNPDMYIVDKSSRTITKAEIRKQEVGLFRTEKGENVKKAIPAHSQERQKISDKEILELARLGKKLEDHYNHPQDVEWAVEKGEVFIVQTRAVTTFKAAGPTSSTSSEVNARILLQGETASAGVYSGVVKMVLDPSELNKIKPGDILVTTMTTPDMVPAMQRAGAIITNEGGMTCFSGDTKILTTNGFLTMEQAHTQLQSGSVMKVLSFNPISLKVEWKSATSPQRRKARLLEVAVSQTGRSKQNLLRLTPDHKMVGIENRKVVERKVQDILSNQEMVCVADYLPAHQNPHVIDEPDKAYLCGALFTDGYINSKTSKGSVTFIQKEIPEKQEFINSVKNRFSSVFGTGMNYNRLRTTKGNMIRGGEINGSASDFICFKKKPAEDLTAIKEKIVDWVLHLNKESLHHFLAGVIDGDGSFNVSRESGRINIYASKEYLAQGIILACLRLGILPQVSKNRRSCYNIQIVDNIPELLSYTTRVKGNSKDKILGTKLFGAKAILSDIIESVNFKGRVKPYLTSNLLLDARKIRDTILPLIKDPLLYEEMKKIIQADFRMQRLSRISDWEEREVYNFEVEDNHTYVVFTENYTPLIVWNCHAAIVSREMGTPCIVGTEHATDVLKEGEIVTLDASRGIVYEGKVDFVSTEHPTSSSEEITTKTHIKVILDIPEVASKAAATGAEGVGLIRSEIIIAKGGVHPAEYIRQGKQKEYIALLKKGIGDIAHAFSGRPVWVRCSDMRSDEYRNLKGGDKEPHETDPMIGWHGIRRLLDEPEILKAEFQAVRELHYEGLKNVGVMIPFIIRVNELQQAKEIMRSVGLEPCKAVDFGIMVETPAACWIIEDLCKEGISFVSFGTNDLTQLTLGIDRNNSRLNDRFDELHPAVLGEIAKVIKVCKKYGVKTSICGQAGSRPEMAEFLVHQGIDSISSNVDAVGKIRKIVSETEKKVMGEK